MLEKILMPPLRGAEVAVVGASADSANRKWCETVYVAFDQLLAGKYPFASGRVGEAKLRHREILPTRDRGRCGSTSMTRLPRISRGWEPMFRLKEGGSVHYREDFLKFLTHAAELTSRIFAKEPLEDWSADRDSHPSFGAVLKDHFRPWNEENHWAQLDGSLGRVRVAHPPRAISPLVKKREVETIGPRDEGEWAFFYLLAAGINPSKNGDYVTVTYTPNNGQNRVLVDFKPENLREVFQKFALPKSITTGGRFL